MKYEGFEVSNFKGIRKVNLSLASEPKSKIFTLVGLNESGKTTIMEALAFFYENLGDSETEIQANAIIDVHSLIPKNQKDNFNEDIEIKANILLEDEDIRRIEAALSDIDFICSSCIPRMSITQKYKFENSIYQKKNHTWSIKIKGKKKKARKEIEISPKTFKEGWDKVWNLITKRLPKIIYYPNFLFDFPDRILLEEYENEGREQKFYRKVIQDILDSLNNNMTLETHIVERAKSNADSEKDALESVINKLGSQITKVVFSDNVGIFNFRSDRSIIVTYPKQDITSKSLYIEMKLKEGEDNFYIRERGLGLRWFLTFRLFTQFRVHRLEERENIIFLLDEPASNLHQTSQQRLLKALEEITEKPVSVIYSTHSHHLINPQWLENTFIVKNKALTYDIDKDDNYNSASTDVTVEKYRSFVTNFPDQKTYFQPILDVLEYRPSNLEPIPNIAMMEGKNDFYSINYFNEVIFNDRETLNILPGTGSGTLDSAIQLYYAWGKNFVILLDSDSEGKVQKERYIEKFGTIVKDRLFTFGDIKRSWHNKELEDLFEEGDKLKIIQSLDPTRQRFTKKGLNRVIQEYLVNHKVTIFCKKNRNNFEIILDFLESKLADFDIKE